MLHLRQEQQTSEPAAHLPGLALGVPGGRVSSAVLLLPRAGSGQDSAVPTASRFAGN